MIACQPIFDCVAKIRKKDSKVILLTPSGKVYKEKMAIQLSHEKHLILICGHYEGFDERIRTICDLEISIGDYVLTGGEIASMVLVDSIVRLLPDVISKDSLLEESFSNQLLDYPTYTKPAIYKGLKVPEVLLSGNHALIEKWRKEAAYNKTLEMRPDLVEGDKNGTL